MFLELNNCSLHASQEEKYTAMIGPADGSIGEAEFARWLPAESAS